MFHRKSDKFRLWTRKTRALRCEMLEHRWPLTLIVDTLVDEADGSVVDGDISLRDAMAVAAPGELIHFDTVLDGGTILLTLGQLGIADDLTIDATELLSGLTVDANDPTPGVVNGDGNRIFNIDDGDNSSSKM